METFVSEVNDLRSHHNKSATVASGALKQDHANVMIQEAKLSNKNSNKILSNNIVINCKFVAYPQILINNFQ